MQTAEFHALPVRANGLDQVEPALTPARHLDRQAKAVKARCQREVEEAATPVERGESELLADQRDREQLRRLYDRDEEMTGQWIVAGRQGPDPGEAADTAQLNAKIAAREGQIRAIERVLPQHRARLQAAVEELNRASAACDAAAWSLMVEVDAELGREHLARLNAALEVEAKRRSLHAAAQASGVHAGMAAAEQIQRQLQATRAAAAVRQDPGFGRRVFHDPLGVVEVGHDDLALRNAAIAVIGRYSGAGSELAGPGQASNARGARPATGTTAGTPALAAQIKRLIHRLEGPLSTDCVEKRRGR